jgi:hypothetical protein
MSFSKPSGSCGSSVGSYTVSGGQARKTIFTLYHAFQKYRSPEERNKLDISKSQGLRAEAFADWRETQNGKKNRASIMAKVKETNRMAQTS